jgi:hypothetical protein
VIVAAGLLVAGMGSLAVVFLALHKAPHGYEDELGFHVVGKVTVVYGVLSSVITNPLRAVSLCRLAIGNNFGAIL